MHSTVQRAKYTYRCKNLLSIFCLEESNLKQRTSISNDLALLPIRVFTSEQLRRILEAPVLKSYAQGPITSLHKLQIYHRVWRRADCKSVHESVDDIKKPNCTWSIRDLEYNTHADREEN